MTKGDAKIVLGFGCVLALLTLSASTGGAAPARATGVTLDPSFGGTGYVAAPGNGQGRAVAVEPDGKILVGGGGVLSSPTLERLLPNGMIDTSFGAGGFGQFYYSCGGTACGGLTFNGWVNALTVDPSGRVVAAVAAWGYGFFLGRFTGDGTMLDSSFASRGGYTTPNSDTLVPQSVGIGPSGLIDVGVNGADWRFDQNGALQSVTGGANAIESIAVPVATLVASDQSTYIALAQSGGPSDLTVAHVLAGGSLDQSYGASGIARLSLPGNELASGLVQLPDGSIVVVGATGDQRIGNGVYWSGHQALIAARFLPGGGLDTQWGNGGYVTVPFDDPVGASAVTTDANGNIAVLGNTLTSDQLSAPFLLELGASNGAVVAPATALLPPAANAIYDAIAPAPGGALVAVGSAGSETYVSRVLTGGSGGSSGGSTGGGAGGGAAGGNGATGPGLPDLQLALTAESANTPPVGSTLVYHVTVSDKAGAGGAFGVTATVTLPPGFTVTKTYSDRGKGCSGTTSPLSCDLDWMSPAVVGHITIWGTVGRAGTLTASASVRAGPGEANPADNSATLTLNPVGSAAPATVRALTPPTVRGTPVPGTTLVATKPTWSGTPATVAYRWELCHASRCSAIPGATTVRLTLLRSYVGADVLIVATANAGANGVSVSSKRIRVRTP